MKPFLFFAFVILTLSQSYGQRRYTSINRLGGGIDVTYAQLQSDALTTNNTIGYAGYLETRGEFSRFFDMVYSLGIFSHNMEIEEFATNNTIDASMLGAEIKLIFALRPFQSEYFTIEAGPAVLLTGELKFDDQDANRLAGYQSPITLAELEKTNPINLNGVIGFSAGTDHIRATLHYHYAFFNMLDSVDVYGNAVEGNLSYWSAGLRFYL